MFLCSHCSSAKIEIGNHKHVVGLYKNDDRQICIQRKDLGLVSKYYQISVHLCYVKIKVNGVYINFLTDLSAFFNFINHPILDRYIEKRSMYKEIIRFEELEMKVVCFST